MENQVDKLTQLGTVAVQMAIENYTSWFFIQGICGVVLAILLITGAVVVFVRRNKWEDNIGPYIISACMAIISALLLVSFIPTLMHPRAEAIHQLLKDVR